MWVVIELRPKAIEGIEHKMRTELLAQIPYSEQGDLLVLPIHTPHVVEQITSCKNRNQDNQKPKEGILPKIFFNNNRVFIACETPICLAYYQGKDIVAGGEILVSVFGIDRDCPLVDDIITILLAQRSIDIAGEVILTLVMQSYIKRTLVSPENNRGIGTGVISIFPCIDRQGRLHGIIR